jgi:hypothetical protein
VQQRRLLVIGSQSLFGSGLVGLLKGREDQFVLETVPDIMSAITTYETFQPDTIICFQDTRQSEQEHMLLHELIERVQTRVILCSLDANQLTIYHNRQIKNATVEDLISATLDGNKDSH